MPGICPTAESKPKEMTAYLINATCVLRKSDKRGMQELRECQIDIVAINLLLVYNDVNRAKVIRM